MAIAVAQAALRANDPNQDHHALECLTQAITALNAELKGLRDGTVPFTGPLALPLSKAPAPKKRGE